LVADDDLVMRDAVIVDKVHEALLATGYGQLRKLQIDCVNSCVRLRGHLSTYYLKQIAQSVTRSVAGVRNIENDVDVVSPR
jgi:osmotically-inducible protein OsmY